MVFMIKIQHEKSKFNVNASGSKSRASVGLGQENSGSLYRNKDSGSLADFGGSASGVDLRGLGSNASELKRLDAQSKREGGRVSEGGDSAWASSSFNSGNDSGNRAEFREISFGIWAKPGALGWSHLGGLSETSFWNKAESSSGAKLDAPGGVSFKTGQLFLFAGEGGGGQEVSAGIKKNFGL